MKKEELGGKIWSFLVLNTNVCEYKQWFQLTMYACVSNSEIFTDNIYFAIFVHKMFRTKYTTVHYDIGV